VSTACTAAPAVARAPLTVDQAGQWALRNLVILMGAFHPTLLTVAAIRGCAGEPGMAECGAAIAFVVPLAWVWLAIPMLLLGGMPMCLVLAVAWRRPWLARALAVLYAAAFVVAFAPPGWHREHPLDVPLVALGILYYAFMLRLDPRQRLRGAQWVWWVPLVAAECAVVLRFAEGA
jgi:hypothetical protein